MSKLQPYPNGGLGPLTEEEQRCIDELSTHDAVVIALGLVEDTMSILASQTNEDHAAARTTGFENAEHDALAFLASDWFEQIIDSLQALAPHVPYARTALEYVQLCIDAALGEGVLEAYELDTPQGVIRRAMHRGMRGHTYMQPIAAMAPAGTDVLDEYESHIRAEQEEPEMIVLELPGFGLAIEVGDGNLRDA
jgi:hypothetical protein